jgi:hypothetical protein
MIISITKKPTYAFIIGTMFGTLIPTAVNADSFSPTTLQTSQSDFGGVGLMQMPTGRAAPDGNFNFGTTISQDYRHYFASIQLFPWLESTIRYTQIPDVLYSNDSTFSGNNIYADKGIDFKIRLIEEGFWLPETSVGIRDFGGTGLFDGEYVAGTKRFGPIDFTLGMGWGYLGQSGNASNPLCKASDRFCDRNNSVNGNGGGFDVQRWFSGPTALYGGIEYQTPYDPLRVKIEYDGNDYSEDFPTVKTNKVLVQNTHWNFGLLHRLGESGDLRLSYERGDIFTVGINLYTNFNTIHSTWDDNERPEPISPNNPNANATSDDQKWQQVSSQLASNAGYKNNAVFLDGDALVLVGEQKKYRNRKEAIERAAIILDNTQTPNITQYKIIETQNGVALTQTTVDKRPLNQIENNEYIGATIDDAMAVSEPTDIADHAKPIIQNNKSYDVRLAPVLSQSFGGSETFYFYNMGFNTIASHWLTDNLEISGSVYVNLLDNYDKFSFTETNGGVKGFAIPRVRTLVRSYVHDHPIRMNQMQLTWFNQPSKNFYTQSYAGYLETMFAGIGSEILYRPMNSNWALGVDANIISQRDPDNWFSVYNDDYYYFDKSNCSEQTIECAAYVLNRGTTGQITTYYQPEWSFIENSLIKVSAGKFLGGDNGVKIDFSKQFDSGVIVGAYAVATDLSTEDYGEGSFNKGFYVNIPFDLLTVKPSTNRAAISWQPITRDGGQVLGKKYELFSVTDARAPWYERPAAFH